MAAQKKSFISERYDSLHIYHVAVLSCRHKSTNV